MRLPNAPPGPLHHPVPGLRGTASLNANRHAVCYFTVLLCGIPLSKPQLPCGLWRQQVQEVGRRHSMGEEGFGDFIKRLFGNIHRQARARPVCLVESTWYQTLPPVLLTSWSQRLVSPGQGHLPRRAGWVRPQPAQAGQP